MTPYLVRALITLYFDPIGYFLVFLNLLWYAALAAIGFYFLYRITGGQRGGLGWLAERLRQPLPVSLLPARVWRAMGVGSVLIVVLIIGIL